MNLQESIRRILKEEVNSVDQKTTQIELIKLMGPSNIKKGNRIEIVNKIMSFGSNIDIIVDYLDQETLDKINNFMSQKGWFPHSIGLSDMKQHKYSQKLKNYIGENDVQIGYEASLPGEFKVNQRKAFHVTPDIYLDKIKETGLTPKTESKLSDHPERIYLFLEEGKNIPKEMVTTIWNSLSKERQAAIKDYYVLEIDLTQIPNHKFYLDPQSMVTFGAVYTTQPIPKSAIKVINKIKTSGIKSYNDEVVMTPEDEKRTREEKKRKEEERLKQEKESAARQAKSDEVSKEFEKLPDDLKNMDIGDLMNLQESIRRILNEVTNPMLVIFRRVPQERLDEEFESSLNYISRLFIKNYKSNPRKLSEQEFTRMVAIDLIQMLDFRNIFPNDVEWYEDVIKALINHYDDRTSTMYNVLKK